MYASVSTNVYTVFKKDGTTEKRTVMSVKGQLKQELKSLRSRCIRANEKTAVNIFNK